MKEFEYTSNFADHINNFIGIKRNNGYAYQCEAWHYKKFDQFCLEYYPTSDTITKVLSDRWCTQRASESATFLSRRITILRQLSIYMNSIGIDCYIPKDLTSKEKPILTIPSVNEMKEFFRICDSRKTNRRYSRLIYEYSILFRLYYCCGLRRKEGTDLRLDDIDTEKMTLTIYHSKGNKDRLVYLPDDFKETLVSYLLFIKNMFPDTEYVFPGIDPFCPISGTAAEKNFVECWKMTEASRNHAKHPTIHCLRHAFVVERINMWSKEGINVENMLPYLSKYLGHKSPKETFYYYHIVESAFSTIMEKGADSVSFIPEVSNTDEY